MTVPFSLPAPEQIHDLLPYGAGARFWCAYSGGLDSTVLLHLLRRTGLPGTLQAIHVHHGLNPLADQWQQHCEAVCRAWGVPLTVCRVQVARKGRQSLEEAARLARYGAFTSHMAAGDCLVTAHHQDDQAETLLLRLLRGAGVTALAGIRPCRTLGEGLLWRPLLGWPRQALEAYAREHGLDWVEDDSNQQPHFDRNYLRLRVLPALRARWPGFAGQWARSQQWLGEAAELCDALAEQDLARLEPRAEPGGASLAWQPAPEWSEARCRNVLRFWLRQDGFPPPPESRLLEVFTAVLQAREDAEPLLAWPGVELRRFRGRLHAMSALPPPPPPGWESLWDGSGPLLLPGAGQLEPMRGEGGLARADGLRVAFRQGGERFHPRGRPHSQSLKKLLQEGDLPPWWRARQPLLYRGDRLVAVPGLGVAHDACAAPGQEGIIPIWHRYLR